MPILDVYISLIAIELLRPVYCDNVPLQLCIKHSVLTATNFYQKLLICATEICNIMWILHKIKLV